MHHQDLVVIEQALNWALQGRGVWLCTVLSTFGSAPRSPGAMLVAIETEEHRGSLSGGCVEEEFIREIASGMHRNITQVVSYGRDAEERDRLQLPCGGSMSLLVEYRGSTAKWIEHLKELSNALRGQNRTVRKVDLVSGEFLTLPSKMDNPVVTFDSEHVSVVVGPALRLLLAGLSPVAHICGQFARTLGFEVVVCDPREEVKALTIDGIDLLPILPSEFIAQGGCHSATAVVALTHDPKIDDLALMEAVKTPAFYIGVMGSSRTSNIRAERLVRIGGLNEQQMNRLHMPIGLNIGSRTPGEIALAVLADIVRVYRGKSRNEL